MNQRPRRSGARRGMLIAAAVALALGCARPGAGVADGDSAPLPEEKPTATGTATGAATATGWVTYQADVTAVRSGPDARSVVVTVDTPAGADGCSRDPRVGYRTEENGMIHANLVQDSRRADEVGGCPSHEPAEVTLTSAKPIGKRVLVLNQQAWTPDGGGYRRCSETLGCDPPTDHCDAVWVQAAVKGMDVSRHSTGDVEACADPWLVMTVPDDPAVCGAAPRDGCDASTTTRRYFLRFAPAGWQVEARSTGAGCAGAPAALPRAMCETLPVP